VVIIAGEQTRGRGKPGRHWFSPPKLGLYLSAIIKPRKRPKDLVSLTLLCAEAVEAAINNISKLTTEIKFPNDVLINGKKVCGILVERVAAGYLIIGIGVNVNNLPDIWPDEIKNSATSLKIEAGLDYDPRQLQDVLLVELDQRYLAYLNKI